MEVSESGGLGVLRPGRGLAERLPANDPRGPPRAWLAPLALAAAEAVGQDLYGVDPADPATLAAVALTLVTVALAAALPAARRASRAQPASVLRQE